MKRIGYEIIENWKEKLSEKLGRSADVLFEKGLSASDFKSGSKVILSNPGELECTFYHAFSVVNPELGKVAVFTEHAGYHEFYLNGLKVSDIIREEYWDEDYQA